MEKNNGIPSFPKERRVPRGIYGLIRIGSLLSSLPLILLAYRPDITAEHSQAPWHSFMESEEIVVY
ncbi:MAG: hypothetical protein IKD66_10195 [Solobacterium sp.]|nr:hypothetical protein [Solobacterium sp.]